jgi:trimeric autotransporter adhesin
MARNNILSVRPQGTARNTPTPRQVLAYPKKIATTWAFAQSELKAYYQFENGAELTDSSPNSSTLTVIGVPVQATPRWGTGCVGLGTSQAFSAEDGADFRPAGNFSVSAWVRTTKTGVSQTIFASWSANTNWAGCALLLSTTNKISVYSALNTGITENTNWKRFTSTNTVTDGAWHHVVGTYDGAKLHVYIDGAEEGTGVEWTNASVFAETNYVRVGCQSTTSTTGSAFFQGCLDEVAFFPSDALSLAQVKSLYAKSITDTSNSAIKALASAVYLFNEGGQLVDSSTGGTHTLTAIGKPTTCTPKFGGSVFLGNSSAYSAVDAAVLKPTGAFSVGGWIKCPGLGTNIDSYIFQSNSVSPSTAGFRLLLNRNTGYAYIYIGKGTGDTEPDINICLGTTDLRDNTWHFVVATWEKPYLKIYVDGVLQNTSSAWNYDIAYNATNYVMVGARNSAGTPAMHHQGQLDDIFLLNGTAWTADEINYLYVQRKRVA